MHNKLAKSALRQIYKSKRAALSKEERAHLSRQLFNGYLKRFKPAVNENIHIFLPIEKHFEIDTYLWISYFWQKNVNVFIPKMRGMEMMSIRYTPETVLEKNSWGILEPLGDRDEEVAFDQVITPLLYADSLGNRVGYGKGFYDRFFNRINQEALKIGLNYFAPKESISDASAVDVSLDFLVLPTEILSFSDKLG